MKTLNTDLTLKCAITRIWKSKNQQKKLERIKSGCLGKQRTDGYIGLFFFISFLAYFILQTILMCGNDKENTYNYKSYKKINKSINFKI